MNEPWGNLRQKNDEFRKWDAMDLRSMAARRDSLPVLTELQIGKETLERHYDTIYAQFSSVSHFDAYSVELLRLHKKEDGGFELKTDDLWPGLLILQNCQFDVSVSRQCMPTMIKMQRNCSTSFFSNGIVLQRR
ncbi:MAG TPA: hypothetical protein VGL97_02410 [Bryobacteraceae bacterium]|jgi:hypothetical protein